MSLLLLATAAHATSAWDPPILRGLTGGPQGIAVGLLHPTPLPTLSATPFPESIVAASFSGFGAGNVRVWTWGALGANFGFVDADLAAGNNPIGVAIGDAAPPAGLNEIVVANSSDGTLSLFAANLSPTPSPAFVSVFSPLSVGGGTNPVAVAVAEAANDPLGSGAYRTIAVAANASGEVHLFRHNGSSFTQWVLPLATPASPASVAFGLFPLTPGATPSPVLAVSDGSGKTVHFIVMNASPVPSPYVAAVLCLPPPAPSVTGTPHSLSLDFGDTGGGADTLAVSDPSNHRVLLFSDPFATPTALASPPLSAGGAPVHVKFHSDPGCTCTPSQWPDNLIVVEEAAQTLWSLCNSASGASAATGYQPRAAAAGDLFGTGKVSVAVSIFGTDQVAIYAPPGAIPSPQSATPTLSPTFSSTATVTPASSSSATASATDTPTTTSVPSSTHTVPAGSTDTPTLSLSPTASPTPTATHTRTAVLTTTWTTTASASRTPDTPSPTATATETATATPAAWGATRNFLEPRKYDVLRVALPQGHGETVSAVYTSAGQLVRNLGRTDAATGFVLWDGLNDQGDVVSVGIYLVYLRTEIGARFFKVAVIH